MVTNVTNKKQEAGRDYQSLKCREADARNAEWQKLSPVQQLTNLDERLGKGLGAAKQRAKLARLISGAKRVAVAEPQQLVEEETDVDNKQTKPKAKDRRRQERERAGS